MTGQAIPARNAPALGTAPESAAVKVWWFDCSQPGPTEIESLARMLPADQQTAAARFGNDFLYKRHVVAQAMLLNILGRHATSPKDHLVLKRSPSDKPYIAGPGAAQHLRFNLAHSGAMAVAPGRKVGVDIEVDRPDIDITGVARLSFTKREMTALAQVPAAHRVAAFFACWTRKEALLEAHGTGLMRPPAEVEVGLGQYDPQKTFSRTWDR
jgi:4'-phosphopantetheinyl transferase